MKTISHVKRNSSSQPGTGGLYRDSNLSDTREEDSLGPRFSWDKSDEFQRNKLKSATEVNKVSKFGKEFGKEYVNNKSSKTS